MLMPRFLFATFALGLAFSGCDLNSGTPEVPVGDLLSQPAYAFLAGTWKLKSSSGDGIGTQLQQFTISASPRSLSWDIEGMVLDSFDAGGGTIPTNCHYRGSTAYFAVVLVSLEGSSQQQILVGVRDHCQRYELITGAGSQNDPGCADAVAKLNAKLAKQECSADPQAITGMPLVGTLTHPSDSTLVSEYSSLGSQVRLVFAKAP
jgi:hypothetical protein